MSGLSANGLDARQFTLVAYDDLRVERDNLAGRHRTTRERLVPFCMFTDPELARVGLNERSEEAWRVLSRGENPMAAVLRTRTVSEPRGFIKMLIGETSDQTLGLSAFCAEVSDLMAAVQTAMLGHLLVLRDALYASDSS